MRPIALALLVTSCSLLVCTMGGADVLPPELQAAQDALSENLTCASPLAGKPVTDEQAATAEKLADEGLAAARGYAAIQPGSPEARHLIGMLLVFAYRPVVAEAMPTNDDGSTPERPGTRLCRGTKDCCQRGLAELRAATRLAPQSVQYQLDYAEGMQICGQSKGSAGLLEALWTRGPEMTGDQKTRAARLLAQAAREQNRPQEEARWLCEALNCSPEDEAASARLEELLAVLPPSVFWLNYEAGTQVARRQDRPMMMSVMATWCPSCRRLNAETYSNAEVIALSKKFVCVWVDTDRQPDVARMHAAAKIPTIVFLDPQGRELHRLVGFRQADVFMSEMRQALRSQG